MPATSKNLWGGKKEEKEKAVRSLRQPCSARSSRMIVQQGTEATELQHVRATETGRTGWIAGPAWGRGAAHTTLPFVTEDPQQCVSAAALGSPRGHMADTPRRKLPGGRGLSLRQQVAAPGGRTNPSTVCTWHGGQVKEPARCSWLMVQWVH